MSTLRITETGCREHDLEINGEIQNELFLKRLSPK
jgi:hypothetical protein